MTARAGRPVYFATTVGAALGLLALAALVLLAGDLWLAPTPALAGLWTLLTGLALLFGAMFVALLAEVRAPLPEPASEAVAAEAQELDSRPSSPSLTVEEDAAARPSTGGPTPASASLSRVAPLLGGGVGRAAPAATSIMGAYLQSLGDGSDRAMGLWTEVAPPIAAALPFSPGLQRRPEELEGSETAPARIEEPRLELELARLRARLRELEPMPGPARAAPRPVAASGPEPPAPPVHRAVGSPACLGCGSGVDARSPKLLCWACGRTLCAACYWRFGPGPGLHRCPDCAARAPRTAPVTISGGRSGPQHPLSGAGEAPPGSR